MDESLLMEVDEKEELLQGSAKVESILRSFFTDVADIENNDYLEKLLKESGVDNDDSFIQPPTPAGVMLGKDTDLWKKIIKMLSNPKDRKNIELVSRDFYALSNDPSSYLPLSRSEDVLTQFISGGLTTYQFIIHGREVILNILKPVQDSNTDFENLRGIIKKYTPNMGSLYFLIAPSNYYEVFKDLKCFDGIKTVKFDIISLIRAGIRIFKECPDLRPTNVHIKSLSSIETEEVHDSLEFQFPVTVKNIYFESNPEYLEWLLPKVSYHGHGHFDSLTISEWTFRELINSEMKETFLEIIEFFKEISYYNEDFHASPFDVEVGKILLEHNIAAVVNVYFSEDKQYKDTRDGSEMMELSELTYRKRLRKKNRKFLGLKGVYLNVYKLIISDKISARKHRPFSSDELESLIKNLRKMKKLRELEVDLCLFKSFPDFREFLNGIRGEVKALKIGGCSTIMNYHLPVIKSRCSMLEFLYLEDVGPYTTVTINSILENIKGLKGLKIVFNNFYNFKHILGDLEKEIDGKKYFDLDNFDIGIFDGYPRIKEENFTSSIKKKNARERRGSKRRSSKGCRSTSSSLTKSNNSTPLTEDRLIRRRRRMTISDVKDIFSAFNSGSSVYKGARHNVCAYMVDSTFDLGLALAFSRDFVDDTDFGAAEVLRMPSYTDFQSSNNLRMFSTETITTSHLKRTLNLSNYEPFDNFLYLFKDMDIDVVKKSRISYVERKRESDAYKEYNKEEISRRRGGKKVIDCPNTDIDERCFMLTLTFRIFEDEESMRSFRRYSANDAKDVLAVLEPLLASYTVDAVVEAIGVSRDVYEKGYELLQERSEGIFPDGDSETSQESCVVGVTCDYLDTDSCKENNVLTTDSDKEEPLLKKKKKMALHDGCNVDDEDGEDDSPLNNTFRGVPPSKNNNATKIIKPDNYFTDEFEEKVLRMNPEELSECFENYPDGIYLNLRDEDGTVCKYELDITIREIAVLVRKIIAKTSGHKKGDLRLIAENSFYKCQLMSSEDDSLVIEGRQLRRRSSINYSGDSRKKR
uniref:F-box domain-containing protein n=1 Tax=Strongyloides papillosus TaxID=174720 RepID=A0A0N5BBU7_STREA